MEKNSKFNAARRNGASPAKRPARASKLLSNAAFFDHWPYLQQARNGLQESRPEAVLRAKKLIAAPDYPSQLKQRILARRLAVQLTAENDSLPT